MKLTAHARVTVALSLAMLLGSCDSPQPITRDEVIDIADDAVDVGALVGQLEQLESRIAALEERQDSDDRSIKLLLDTGQSGLDREGDMSNRLSDIEERLNM